MKIKIGKKSVSNDSPVFIIAEAGINHNGSMKIAKKMIDAAKDCGVDAIKFQTFKTDDFVSDKKEMYEYVSQGSVVKESMYEMFKRYEFQKKDFCEISKYCAKKNIIFFSTPQNESDLNVLLDIGIPVVKIGSDDLTNLPLLEKYAKVNLPVIISTGMAYVNEIDEAVRTIFSINKKLLILHCISSYPANPVELNLLNIKI